MIWKSRRIFVLCHNNQHPILKDCKVNLTVGKFYFCDRYDDEYGWQYHNDLGERVENINQHFVHLAQDWEIRESKLKELGI